MSRSTAQPAQPAQPARPARTAPSWRRRLLAVLVATATLGAVTAVPALTGATATAAPLPGSLIVNGDFEDGPPPAPLVFYTAGGPVRIPGWTVTTGSVETDGDRAMLGPWNPASGRYSLDLNGNQRGELAQTVSGTRAGYGYRLTFAAAVHPVCGPPTGRIDVRWDGALAGSVTATRVSNPDNPGWVYSELQVLATGPSGVLTFASGVTAGSCGPILDDVSLVEVPVTLDAVSLTAAPTTAPGADQVPVADIPFDQLPGSALATIAAAPLRSVPLRSVPLRSVPLRSVPLRSVPLRSVPLRSVTLNQLPLSGSPSWTEVLLGTALEGLALQQVTLDDVLAADPPRLAQVSLGAMDLSASPLRSVALASLYLGGVSIGDLPLVDATGAFTGRTVFDALCSAQDCPALALTPASPVLAADLAGIPLRSVPLDSVPLRSVPVAAPLRSVPLRSVPLRSVPLRSVPLRSVDGLDVGAAAALAQVTLAGLDPTAVVLTSVPYAAVEGSPGFGPCPTCTTLGSAAGSGGPAAAATLGQLAATGVLGSFTLGDLGPFTGPALAGLTIGDVADGMAPTFSLASALLSLIDPDQVPWEFLPFAALDLPRYDVDGAKVRYTAAFTLTNRGADRDATLSVTLPDGFEYAGGVTGLPAASATPTVTGRTVRWDLTGLSPGTPAAAVAVSFDVRPPLELAAGTATMALSVTAPTLPSVPVLTGASSRAVTVVESGSTDPATAPVAAADTLVVGHTSAPGEVTYVRLPVPPAGTRIAVYLSHQPADNDLAVFGPEPTEAEGGTGAASPSAAPLRSVPLRSVPLTDPGVDATGASSPLGSVQDDIPRATGLPLVGVSAQRGTAEDEVGLLSPGGGGFYTLQVSGYNGSSSPQPWMLRVRYTGTPPVVCPARTHPAQVGAGSALPPGVTSATRSLFLLNAQQLRAEYGAAETTALLDRLRTFAARADVAGAVIEADTQDGVAAAYTAWNADPCSIEAANAAVRSVTSLVLAYRAANPGIASVTLVGSDAQVPMARVPDLTSAVNERGFAAQAAGAGGLANPFTASQSAGFSLSDDPYGTLTPVPWLGRGLYVPDLALGRLVETPTQITGQLEQFVAAGGVVDPTTSLTSGYDFLSDGARAVDAGLARNVTGSHGVLINETWDRADLLSRLLPTTGAAPALASVNAHFDPSRALPAAGNASGDETDLLSTTDLTSRPRALAGSLLFSMGCHAGLNIPAGYSGIVGAPDSADWPKTLAAQRALWVANTGYGLGDTATVALTEQLMADFATRLDGTLVAGAALTFAKQAYLGSLGTYGAADEKVLQQIVFYGLPMYRIGGPRSDGGTAVALPPSPAPATVATTVDADPVGLPTADTTVAPSFVRTDTVGLGSFWGVRNGTPAGETQTTAGAPIQPRTSLPALAADGTVGEAHGVLVTSLTSRDIAGVQPRFARAVADLAAHEPAQAVPGVTFPSSLATLTTFLTPGGQDTRQVLTPGLFFSSPDQVTGVQRLFDSVGTRTYYSTSPDHTPPTFRTLGADRVGSDVTFTVDVGAGSGQSVERVLVLVRDGSAAAWRPVELAPAGGSTWAGTLRVASGSIEWFAQAVSSVGTVGVSVNKGDYFGSPGTFEVSPLGTLGDEGIYTGDVTITVAGPASRYAATVDGVLIPSVNTFVVTGEGPHRVEITGNNGDRATLDLLIDSVAPVVSVADPADGVLLLNGPGRLVLACDDGPLGSGVVGPCPGPLTVPTTEPGPAVAAVTVRDRAGNVGSTVAYRVGYRFTGFLSPVSNTARNDVTAGSTVPVKFQLSSATGPVTTLSAVTSLGSTPVSCGATGTTGVTSPATTADLASLTVDAYGQYQYNWKTPKSFAGQCRVLTLTLADRSQHSVTFRLG